MENEDANVEKNEEESEEAIIKKYNLDTYDDEDGSDDDGNFRMYFDIIQLQPSIVIDV
jgi:hypothetical protein